MSAMNPQMDGQAPPPPVPIFPDGTRAEDPTLGVNAMLRAVRVAAENAAAEKLSDVAKDWADTALKFAQAIVVLDPSLSQGGTPLDHDVALKQIEGQTQATVADIQRQAAVEVEHTRGEHALRQAREVAAAPTPVKKVTINRENGRATGAKVEG